MLRVRHAHSPRTRTCSLAAGPRARRAGAALLEVLVALTVLSVAGIATLSASRQAAEAVERARWADEETRAASAFLDAVALWPRADLDRHLGVRDEGAWHLRVDRHSPTIYRVTLTDTSDVRVLLATSLYRPEATFATP